jgi:hypothetical protein
LTSLSLWVSINKKGSHNAGDEAGIVGGLNW